MSQTYSGVTFSNINSGSPELYVATAPGNHWAAILLPQGSTYVEDTIDLPNAALQQVYFLFASVAPPASGADTFIKNYRPYLLAYRQKYVPNLTIGWLSDPDVAPTQDNTTVINFTQTGSSGFGVGQTFNTTIGSGFATLTIVNNTSMAFMPADAPVSIQLSYTSGSPNMSFANKNLGSQSLFNSDISIPFSGEGTGSLRFSLGINAASDFIAYALQCNFAYGDADNPTFATFPILQPGTNASLYAMTQAEIDFLDIDNKEGLNTYFALTGQVFNTNTGNLSPAGFLSNFTINTGYPLTLWPAPDFMDSGAPVNNLYPNPYCARFIISPVDNAGLDTFYLVPEGDFYLDPGAGQAQFADENGQFNFLPGLSGTEVITFTPYANSNGTATGDVIRFIGRQNAYAANFPGKTVSLADPGTDKPVLSNAYLTAWANIVSRTVGGGDVQYASQPQGASLYAKDHGLASANTKITGFLGFFEPSVDMPQAAGFYVPMVPYMGVTGTYPPGSDVLNTFESKVLSAARKALVTASFSAPRASKSIAKRATLETVAGSSSYTVSTTPQGLVANVMDTGKWSLLNLAQNTGNGGTPEYLNPQAQVPVPPPEYQLSFINLLPQLQSAFLTNQQFLVMTNYQYLGQLFSLMKNPQGGGESSDPVFNNKMFIEDWPFDINVGTRNTYADYNNVVIFKFCQGALLDRVKNPKDWTQALAFNIPATDGKGDSEADYNQLVAISSWLQKYFQDAEDAYANALANPSSNQLRFYQKFHDTITSANWNGILVLKADINLQEFPQQLKGLISGINLQNFNAHHFGIEVNRVDSSGTITMDPVSSLFGLINYVDPAYSVQVAQGLNPNKPIPPTAGATYDFKVLFLQVLFENTAIKDFASKVQLTMNNLFSDSVIGTNNAYGAGKLNTVVLNGTYQDHNGTAVYVFDNKDDNLFYFDSNLLQNVEITKIQFNTLTTDPAATAIQSRFLMWGYLNFGAMSNTIPPQPDSTDAPTQYTLDAFSFGLANSTGRQQSGLNYSSLYINMGFDINTPSVVSYSFDAGQIAFNSSQSAARPDSLYPNFALQITNLLSGNGDTQPVSLGYLTLSVPNINATGLSGDWYGLQMTLNLGTPGELASSLGFNASLLLAWSPGSKAGAANYNALIGIKLPGTSGNAKLLSLQGLLKLSIDQLRLQYVTEQNSYLLTLSNIALKFLGILKLPPGGNTDFLLFGNPNPGATAKSLGWYAAYNKSE